MKPRIIYGCPISNTPSGGVKVIYKHSELLCGLDIESYVWHPGNAEFRCSWFENKANTIEGDRLNPATDFIVIPEIWATHQVSIFKDLGFKVGIFVQNSYLTHINLNTNNHNAIFDAYREADIVFSISQDTSSYIEKILLAPAEKIIIQRYSINHDLFFPKDKKKLVTFMPRKMKEHSTRVVSALTPLLSEGWEICALDQLSERQVANSLSESIIFLAFSEFEGLPVPPVEAALCGNIVIGYHGQGGKEYWRRPNFVPIEQGDIQSFVHETIRLAKSIESGRLDIDSINSGISTLADYFSPSNELLMLENMCVRINGLYS